MARTALTVVVTMYVTAQNRDSLQSPEVTKTNPPIMMHSSEITFKMPAEERINPAPLNIFQVRVL